MDCYRIIQTAIGGQPGAPPGVHRVVRRAFRRGWRHVRRHAAAAIVSTGCVGTGVVVVALPPFGTPPGFADARPAIIRAPGIPIPEPSSGVVFFAGAALLTIGLSQRAQRLRNRSGR